MFINLKFKWRQSLPQNKPIPAQGLSLSAWANCCIHQCTAGMWPVCIWILEFCNFILFYFYYTAPSVQSVPSQNGSGLHKQRKTRLKEELAERLKLLLIHYLGIYHVLVSALSNKSLNTHWEEKQPKVSGAAWFHQLLGSVQLRGEAWLWRLSFLIIFQMLRIF